MRSDHPIAHALAARPTWEPATLTRVMFKVSRGVREVSGRIDPVEGFWHELADDTLVDATTGDRPPLWVSLGDSLAQGIGASTIDHGWVPRLHAALAAAGRPHAVLNLSRSGSRSGDVLEDQMPLLDLLPYEPSIVTVCVGANDLMRNPNPARVAARLERLATAVPEGTIVSTLPAPRVSPTGFYVNRTIRRAAADHGLQVAEVGRHLVAPHRGLAGDRFHPNDRGYGAWVRAFSEPMGLDAETVPATGTLTSSRRGPSAPGTTTSG